MSHVHSLIHFCTCLVLNGRVQAWEAGHRKMCQQPDLDSIPADPRRLPSERRPPREERAAVSAGGSRAAMVGIVGEQKSHYHVCHLGELVCVCVTRGSHKNVRESETAWTHRRMSPGMLIGAVAVRATQRPLLL